MMRRSQISRRELKSTSDHKLVLTGTDRGSPSGTQVHPNYAWGNRGPTPIRVWMPVLRA
jgi:hypothetical protein